MSFNLANYNLEQNKEVLFANFNQDCSALAVATKKGYRLYSLNSVENVELIYDNNEETTNIYLIDRLFSSSLIAMVSIHSPRRLKVCHFRKGSEICNFSYVNSILAIKTNRLRLVVVLEGRIIIHSIRDMKVLHTITDTPSNPKGLCCLSPDDENSYFTYPASTITGDVQLFDATTLKGVCMISAHDSPVAAMTFNSTAQKLATASDKGTVIRVFGIPSGQKLFQFRRGLKRCVSIGSLAFSPDSMFLCVSSNTETIHIFKLENQQLADQAADECNTWGGFLRSYLPTPVSEVLAQDRDFATVMLSKDNNKRIVCGITVIQNVSYILVVDDTGMLYVYTLDIHEGGECPLLHQHMLGNIKSTSDKDSNVFPSTSNQNVHPRYHTVTPEADEDEILAEE